VQIGYGLGKLALLSFTLSYKQGNLLFILEKKIPLFQKMNKLAAPNKAPQL
jgi:hypothetical protein